MKLTGPDRYIVTVSDRRAEVQSRCGKPHFVVPATSEKKPKLYVVSNKGQLLYIGATNQSMSVRLRGGLTAHGAHGYHGYSWGKKYQIVDLDVWYLTESENPAVDLETIEAEVVFLFRQKTDQWPSEQTEIHFHPSKERHRICAEQIFESLHKDLGCDQ